jgi:hypothetical protein
MRVELEHCLKGNLMKIKLIWIFAVSLVCMSMHSLGYSQTDSSTVTPAMATATAFSEIVSERAKEKNYPIFTGEPQFYLYSFSKFNPGQEPKPQEYEQFVEDLKNKSLSERNEVGSHSPNTDIAPDLISQDMFTPALGQELWSFVANENYTVCLSEEVHVTGFYLADGMGGTDFCFKTDGPKNDFFAAIPPNTRPERGTYEQKELTFDQITAVLKKAASIYKDASVPGTPDEVLEKFNSDYDIDNSFGMVELQALKKGETPIKFPEIQVVQLTNPGVHYLCLIKIGDDLIIQDHSRVLKVVMFNKKTYFLFETGNGYESSNIVFELKGLKLEKIFSQTIATD